MSWFLFALISLLGWGFADLFYKKGTDEDDRYSHLKIAVWVGLVMGVCSFILMPFAEMDLSFGSFISAAVRYSPASLCYIISMVIGYAGLRYLELSIVSPVQNASGALSTVFMIIYFVFIGRISYFWDEFSVLDVVGSVVITLGVIALAVVEHYLGNKEHPPVIDPVTGKKVRDKHVFGALALLFPILYCIFDTIGTAADGIILDEEAGLGLGEIDVLIIYGLTFLLMGIVSWIYMWIRCKKPYNPFARSEWNKGIAACCEEFGQIFYVYAMASNPMLSAPMIGSYCIVSVILGRIFVKEKLHISQYACILAVITGIVILGISEGLAS